MRKRAPIGHGFKLAALVSPGGGHAGGQVEVVEGDNDDILAELQPTRMTKGVLFCVWGAQELRG